MSEKASINLLSISKLFGNRPVLENISFNLDAGQALCVCGPNAAGKTTLVRIAATVVRPDAGSVEICGLDVRKEPEKVKRLIGFISHKPMVYPQLTVVENLRFFARIYGLKAANDRIDEVLEQGGLGAYRDQPAGILSAGITQRLAICRAILHRPKVLLADEPFAGLDQDAAGQLTGLIRDFAKAGGVVVLTSHNVRFSLGCCDRVAVLDDKAIVFNEPVSQIDVESFAHDYLCYVRKRH